MSVVLALFCDVETLGSVLRRPTIFPMPEAVVKTAFGQMGEETLLISQRAVPKVRMFVRPVIS